MSFIALLLNSSSSGGTGGQVNMAISAAVALTTLPDALNQFRKKYPDASVRVISGAFTVMFNQMRAGAIDFAIGPRPETPHE